MDNRAVGEREAIWVAKEILRTPFRPLHLQIVQKIAKIKPEDCPPRLIYKTLSFWQRKIKAYNDHALSLEEKKCELSTKDLVRAFAKNKAAVQMVSTTDPNTKMKREERMHIVPILSKYISKDSDEDK